MRIEAPALVDLDAMWRAAEELVGRLYGEPFGGLALNCAIATAHVLRGGGFTVVQLASIAPSNPMFDAPFKLGVRATQFGPLGARNDLPVAGLAFRLVAAETTPEQGREWVLHHHMTERQPVGASEHVLPIVWRAGDAYVLDARPSAVSLMPFGTYVDRYLGDRTHGPTRLHLGANETIRDSGPIRPKWARSVEFDPGTLK